MSTSLLRKRNFWERRNQMEIPAWLRASRIVTRLQQSYPRPSRQRKTKMEIRIRTQIQLQRRLNLTKFRADSGRHWLLEVSLQEQYCWVLWACSSAGVGRKLQKLGKIKRRWRR